jgi:PUA-domain protein
MSQKYRRYTLKSKESRQILTDVAEKLKVELGIIADPKASVETMEADFGALLLVNGKPLLFKMGAEVYPTLLADSILAQLPKIVVDMGAIRYVCNGADIMAPGIVRYEDAFDKGDVVVVVDVTHGKPLALGEALYESNQAQATQQGPIVKSKHHVGDKIWNFAKTVLE